MNHSITYQTTTITLPAGLRWDDEYDWHPMQSVSKRAIDGSLILEATAIPSGRPITLNAGDNYGWITKATVDALRAQLAVPGRQFTLTLADGRSFQVMAAPEKNAIEARPLLPRGNPSGTDYYIATLHLIEV